MISDVLFTCSYTHIAIDMLATSIAQLTFQPMSECEYTEIAVHWSIVMYWHAYECEWSYHCSYEDICICSYRSVGISDTLGAECHLSVISKGPCPLITKSNPCWWDMHMHVYGLAHETLLGSRTMGCTHPTPLEWGTTDLWASHMHNCSDLIQVAVYRLYAMSRTFRASGENHEAVGSIHKISGLAPLVGLLRNSRECTCIWYIMGKGP